MLLVSIGNFGIATNNNAFRDLAPILITKRVKSSLSSGFVRYFGALSFCQIFFYSKLWKCQFYADKACEFRILVFYNILVNKNTRTS